MPHYLNEVFVNAPESGLSLRKNSHALGNTTPEEIKRTTSLNTFKHNLNKTIWKKLESQVVRKLYYN